MIHYCLFDLQKTETQALTQARTAKNHLRTDSYGLAFGLEQTGYFATLRLISVNFLSFKKYSRRRRFSVNANHIRGLEKSHSILITLSRLFEGLDGDTGTGTGTVHVHVPVPVR